MPRSAAALSALLLVLLAVGATPAFAGSTIDTTGFAGTTSYPITSYGPIVPDDNLSQETAQTFVAPSGAQAITRVTVLAAADANQPVWLKLYALGGGAPGTELKSQNVSLAAGGRSLRSFDVSWPVVAGTGYAFAIGLLPADVTGVSSLTLPNVGGANARNVYADGLVYVRPMLPPTVQAWNAYADIDVKFRLDFDGGGTTGSGDGGGGGGTGGGGGGTTPTTSTSPAPSTTSPTTAASPTPTLPAKPLSLKAAKGGPAFPASFTCAGATLSTCSLTVTPPKGARSVRVEILRGTTVVASGAAAKGKAGNGKRRTIRLSAKGALATGQHTVRLTIVTARGKTVRRTATFTA